MEAKVIRNKRYKEGTIVVEVTRTKIDPKYQKRIRYKKKFIAHWPARSPIANGTKVKLIQCAPVSKRKYFRIEGGEHDTERN